MSVMVVKTKKVAEQIAASKTVGLLRLPVSLFVFISTAFPVQVSWFTPLAAGQHTA
jgi:hypothetical protein